VSKKKSTEVTGETEEAVVEETTGTAETTTTQPEDNWEDRFKGLQRTFNRTKNELEKLREKEEDLLEQSETSKQNEQDLKGKLEDLQSLAEKAQTELDRLTGELATQEAKGKRAELIMSDFADLAQFEAKGLLPDAEDEDEMVEKFTAFREALSSTVSAGVEQKLTGTAPSDTGGGKETPSKSKAEIYTRLQQLAGTRDPEQRAEYQRLLAQWDKLVEAET
jgi:hypothetical protein